MWNRERGFSNYLRLCVGLAGTCWGVEFFRSYLLVCFQSREVICSYFIICIILFFIVREEPHRKGHLLLDLFLSKQGKILQRTMVKLGKQLVERQVPFPLVTETFQHMIHLKGDRHRRLTLLQHTVAMA